MITVTDNIDAGITIKQYYIIAKPSECSLFARQKKINKNNTTRQRFYTRMKISVSKY